jgi:ferredoxin/flavodoxin
MNAFVIYCSPAGSTKHVAEVIGKTVANLGHPAVMLDLCSTGDVAAVKTKIRESRHDSLLFIGSPVYAFHAVPPVMEFIERLPGNGKGYSVPFVTWGAVTSGIALHEMGTMLYKKGFPVIGAAKIAAAHSLMWQFDHPLGEGRPDAADDHKVEEMVNKVAAKLKAPSVRTVPPSELNYQPEDVYNSMAKLSIRAARQMLPQRQVIQEACTKCRVCAELCPVDAITLNPYPCFSDNCIICYNCMRLCPEKAITADFSPMDAWLKEKARDFNEDLELKTFI